MIGTEPSQLNYHRALFVCSMGLHRSATGATVGSLMGMNTRACGIKDEALIPLSTNLVLWADTIYFMKERIYYKALRKWWDTSIEKDVRKKAVVWDIEDDYDYMEPELVEIVEKLLTQ
ncbi:hypothetical protein EB001_11575 [bacterium]|nr:hypothetical protein [bacterium]